MTSRSIIDEQFTDGFNEANACYKADKLFECIDLCYKLLDEPNIPRYHKMKTLVLLGATVGDWDEAYDCLVAAESLWKIVRRWHPEGKNATLDTGMAEIRESIEELNQALKEEQPSHFGVGDRGLYIVDEEDAMLEDGDAALDIVDEEGGRIADARAMLEDLDIDEDTPSLQDPDREPVSDISLDLYSSKSRR
jgi:hypothetical protein